MKSVRSWLPLLLAAALLWLGTDAAQACPACKLIDKDSAQDLQRAGEGFSLSVLFMLVFPMSLVGGLVAYIVHTVKKIDAQQP